MDAAKLKALHHILAHRLEVPKAYDKQRAVGRAKILLDRDVDFFRVAKVSIQALRHYAKATAFCFVLADRTTESEGLELSWHERFGLGSYLLHQMVLMELCTVSFSFLDQYNCLVVLLTDDPPPERGESATSEFRFPRWESANDRKGNFLTARTAFETPEWNFTGAAPKHEEERLWHPAVEGRFLTPEWQRHSITSPFVRPKEYQRNPIGFATWVIAVNHVESNEYRINKDMLKLVDDLDNQLPDGYVAGSPVENPAVGSRNYRQQCMRDFFEALKKRAEVLAKMDSFYQRCYVDYRGRMYLSRSIVNYQGDDMARSFIEFARGVELNDEGFDALLLHAANLYECKGSIEERTEFARGKLKEWIAYANDALGTYNQWRVDEDGVALDDPLQFIRACVELRDGTTSKRLIRKKGFITHLPVETDQSNSVVQHLAALRTQEWDRDEQTDLARQSNLAAAGDLYEALARTIRISRNITDKERRKLIKKMLVPRVYGAGRVSIARQWKELGIPAISRLSKTQREARVVNAIRALERAVPAIQRFRRDARRLIRDLRNRDDVTKITLIDPKTQQPKDYIDKPLRYSLPSGFVVELAPYQTEPVQMRVAYSRKEHLKTGNQGDAKIGAHERISHLVDLEELNLKVMSAIIHSLDATVAQKVCAHASFPTIPIHDAWSCHANNAAKLRHLFKREFTLMHQAEIPWFVIRRDVVGDGLPVGILGYDPAQEAQLDEFYLEIGDFDGSIS